MRVLIPNIHLKRYTAKFHGQVHSVFNSPSVCCLITSATPAFCEAVHLSKMSRPYIRTTSIFLV